MSNDLNIEWWISVWVSITDALKNFGLKTVKNTSQIAQLRSSDDQNWADVIEGLFHVLVVKKNNSDRFVGVEEFSQLANDGNDARTWNVPSLNMIGMPPIQFSS